MRLAVLLLFAVPLVAAPPGDLERQRLLAHFEMTESWLGDEVSHLTPDQLRYRPSPSAWNILDCVEHLDLSETEYWTLLRKVTAEKPGRKLSPSQDVTRLWYGIDRTERQKTVPSETPKSTFPDLPSALADFHARRALMLQYVRTSQDDWRHYLIPDWDRDAFQWLLMISAHSQRHILQIREIKHSANFPQ